MGFGDLLDWLFALCVSHQALCSSGLGGVYPAHGESGRAT